MLTVQNINSSITPPPDDLIFAANRAGHFSHLVSSIPVYLVNPQLMDRIYPPQRRRFLNPRCAREIIDTHEDREEDLDVLLEKLERCREISSVFTAVGVYFPTTHHIKEIISEETGVDITSSKAIFICPERIENCTQNLSREYNIPLNSAFRTLFAKVFIHEFAHAYMDEGKGHNQAWERIIEESLANAFAYKYLLPYMRNKERFVFEQFASSQPLEYRGYKLFVDKATPYFDSNIGAFAKAWAERKPPSLIPFPPLYHPNIAPIIPISSTVLRRLKMEHPPYIIERYISLIEEINYLTRKLYKLCGYDTKLSYYKMLAINILKLFS